MVYDIYNEVVNAMVDYRGDARFYISFRIVSYLSKTVI